MQNGVFQVYSHALPLLIPRIDGLILSSALALQKLLLSNVNRIIGNVFSI